MTSFSRSASARACSLSLCSSSRATARAYEVATIELTSWSMSCAVFSEYGRKSWLSSPPLKESGPIASDMPKTDTCSGKG